MNRISEYFPNEPAPGRRPLVVVIGGVATSARHYQPMVANLPNILDVRTVELPDGGRGAARKTYDYVREEIERLRETSPDRHMSVIGHSFGGLAATKLAVAGLADRVITLATPHKGILSVGPWPMTEVQRDVVPGSDFIEGTLEDMERRWPEGVLLTTVAATFDPFAPPSTQLGIKLPASVNPPEHFQVVSHLGGATYELGQIDSGWRNFWGLSIPVDHRNLPHAPGLQRWLGKRLTERARSE